MKHYRLLGILLLLENNHVMTAQEIADHFEVSVRTIYRDIDVLSEAGYGVVTESGKGGGISLLYSKRLRLSAMDEHELIKVAGQFAPKDGDDMLSQNIALKIRSQLPPEAQRVFDRLTDATLIDHVSWFGKVSTANETLMIIQEGIIHSKKIVIDYTSGSGYSSGRVIWPMGTVKKSNQSYLVGYCEKRSEYRTFNVDKISKIALLSEIFEMDQGFNLKNYWRQSTGNYSGQTASPVSRKEPSEHAPHYPVTLRCTEAFSKNLSGFKLLEMTTDGCYTYDFISEDIALSQLFNHGEHVIVLSPPNLIQAILNKATHIISHYTSK